MEPMEPKKTRILLVDDDEDTRFMVRDAIEESNLDPEIYEVETGEEAIEFLSRTGKFSDCPLPELIFLDLEMPGIGGLNTLREIRSREDFRYIPVVVMTNIDDDREKKRAAEFGANSYTVKPSDPDRFIETVKDATRYWSRVHRRPHEE